MKSICSLSPLLHVGCWASLAAFICCTRVAAQTSPGTPVFTPTNPSDMQPIPAATNRPLATPAYQAAQQFQRGVNLGDYLEANRHHRSIQVSAGEFTRMKQEGFDHVRVPIGWHQYAGPGPEYQLEPEIFALVDFVVTNAIQNNLAVMINLHHFNALDHDPAGATAEFLALWQQIATHYRQFPARLAFELDNEPHENATTERMNPLYAQAIAEIRRTNPRRTIFAEPGNWGNISELSKLVLPPDDNVIVSVHCYEPFMFTHQGASWTTGAPVTGVVFPGPPSQPLVPPSGILLENYQLDWINKYNTLPTAENPSGPQAFTAQLQYVRAWSDYYGRPVHLGEFGAYIKADETSRANFYAAMRQAAESRKIGWCLWDWSANFRYWDQPHDRPMPGMHAALFGKRE